MRTFIFTIIFVILFFAGLNYIFTGTFNIFEFSSKPTIKSFPIIEGEQISTPQDQSIFQEEKLAESLNLKIPFIVQAPFSDWSYPFNHNCEEAAVLMVHYFFEEISNVNPAKTKIELLELVEFETKTYGFHEDTTAKQTAQLIEDYYGYKTNVIYDISLDDIKRELNSGNPVIVPTVGRELQNPYFTPPGPLYHMLVIKGYTSSEFITNDPGTKNGADFTYSYEILKKAMSDFNEGEMENGRNAMMIVYPNE
ncbi:C39 family peptidase [Patescibacteria group bacterium]